MKYLALALSFACITMGIKSQNLISNFDFSLVDPIYGSELTIGAHRTGMLDSWVIDPNSAYPIHTLLHENASYPELRPGVLHPRTIAGKGMPYLYLYTFDVLWDPEGGASFFVNTLKEKLQEDTVYCFEAHFRLAAANVGPSGIWYPFGTHTLDSVGVYFSDTNSLGTRKPYQVGIKAHIVNQSGLITDSMWHKMEGTYKANGTEQYAIIGVFNPLEATKQRANNIILPPNFLGNRFYSFMDAVFLYNCKDTLFEVFLDADTIVCPGEPLELTPVRVGFNLEDTVTTYKWYRDEILLPNTDSTLFVNASGLYRVDVTINHRYTQSATMRVDWYPEMPDTALLPAEIVLCLEKSTSVYLPEIPYTTYDWSSGETGRRYQFFQPGHFGVTITSPCWQRTDATEVVFENCNSLWVPNAFTPDGDGLNDFFEIQGARFPIKLWVFDRWGNLVYQSEDYQNTWDGTYPNGSPVPAGVYSYKITWNKHAGSGDLDKFGSITILR